jgi:hypothetical protein
MTNGSNASARQINSNVMMQIQLKKLAIAAAILLGGTAAVFTQPAAPKPAPGDVKNPPPASVAPSKPAAKTNAQVLLFRNQPSWNRSPDFEDRLEELGIEFVVKPASSMRTLDLSPYRLILIPGAQWRTDFYATFNEQSDRFNHYVTNGGVLVLELNGAEDDGVLLPRGVSLTAHGAVENTILVTDHPALTPLGSSRIRANFASHGFLEGVPNDALLLAAETVDNKADPTKPTFIEYPHGAGRIIAACQCFHDQDRSGRGVLMPSLLTYAFERKWHVPKNAR